MSLLSDIDDDDDDVDDDVPSASPVAAATAAAAALALVRFLRATECAEFDDVGTDRELNDADEKVVGNAVSVRPAEICAISSTIRDIGDVDDEADDNDGDGGGDDADEDDGDDVDDDLEEHGAFRELRREDEPPQVATAVDSASSELIPDS